MSDVNETLHELMERRLRDLGRRRGRGESISLHEAYERLVEQSAGKKIPSYEVFRRIRVEGHTRIKDETASALATMLEVDVNEVLAAAGIRPRLGRFELPTRADRLTGEQRAVVMGVVDAILDAGEQPAADDAGRRPVTPRLAIVEDAQEAARTVGRPGSVTKARRDQDAAGEPTNDDPDDMEPR